MELNEAAMGIVYGAGLCMEVQLGLLHRCNGGSVEYVFFLSTHSVEV
jgi:hypothetical protein